MGYKAPQIYTLAFGFTSSSPADATTYYFGHLSSALNVNPVIFAILVPRAGIVKAAQLRLFSGTIGTAEDWPIVIRKNNTTDYTFATVVSASATRDFINLSLNIPVAQGDYLELKTVTPTWVTNPDTCRGEGHFLIESE